MAMSRSFTESGSDEIRDVSVETCSICAIDGKLQPATHFCFDCGVYGRCICGDCLRKHNIIVGNHAVEIIAIQQNSKWKRLEKELSEERQKVKIQTTLAKDRERRINELEEESDMLNKDLAKERELSRIRGEELSEHQKESKIKEEEVLILTKRLSKLAEANQTNDTKADLSDPHRPTKLAEEYSELYDNEWITAFGFEFEEQGKPEEDIMKLLLGIITETYGVCGDIGRKQNVDDGSKPTKKSARSSGKPTWNYLKDELTKTHSKTISELRKQTTESSISSIIEYFKAQPQFSEWFKAKEVEDYTVRCIKLCWLMNVQDPPIYMERDLEAGSRFDTTNYKFYTRAGKRIAFVVWPALFLHDGGAVLAKGVAQGK